MTTKRKKAEFPVIPIEQLLSWAVGKSHFLYLTGNNHQTLHDSFPDKLFAGSEQRIKSDLNSFDKLETLISVEKDWLYGYFSYDLKNEIENLATKNPATIPVPHLEFVVPETIISLKKDTMEIESLFEPGLIFEQIKYSKNPATSDQNQQVQHQKCKTSPDRYHLNVEKIKNAILEGEFYEMNYCIEFTAQATVFSPLHSYLRLNELSPMPFSAFMKMDEVFLLCASPERFLKKTHAQLISQPIKGTMKRSANPDEDSALRISLANSEKDKAENLMIVDLVRNDLARSSVPGTVVVDELFGVYSFEQVHQMISTVRSTIRQELKTTDLIKNAFPMGSMTGAPKIRVMEEIELLEDSARGLYSGAVGFFSPEGNFDFNVVIRSVIYNASLGRISFHVGSAITADSDPEIEYGECLLKAAAILKTLGIS